MKDLTGKYELPDWWDLPYEDRKAHWSMRYERPTFGYNEYVSKFTYETRKYTGDWLLKNILTESGENALVLDVGCGINPFKGKIKNLIGVEPGTWGNADIQTDLNGAHKLFQKEQFDWVLAIGILHHHDELTIHKMVEQLKDLIKPNGYIACLCKPHNDIPELQDHPDFGAPAYLYPWFNETTDILTQEHNLKYFQEPVVDYTDINLIPDDLELKEKVTNNKTRERIFWIWQKDTTQKK